MSEKREEWPIDLGAMSGVRLTGSQVLHAWEAVLAALAPLTDVEKSRVLRASAILCGVDNQTRIATIVANATRKPAPPPAPAPSPPLALVAAAPRKKMERQYLCSVCRKAGHTVRDCPALKRRQEAPG